MIACHDIDNPNTGILDVMVLSACLSCTVHCTGIFPRVHWHPDAKLIFTHVFFCTKLISNCPCCSINTKLACGIAVSEWLNAPHNRYHCSCYSKALSSFKLNFGLLKWKQFVQCVTLKDSDIINFGPARLVGWTYSCGELTGRDFKYWQTMLVGGKLCCKTHSCGIDTKKVLDSFFVGAMTPTLNINQRRGICAGAHRTLND